MRGRNVIAKGTLTVTGTVQDMSDVTWTLKGTSLTWATDVLPKMHHGYITVEDDSIRYEEDGSDATAATGIEQFDQGVIEFLLDDVDYFSILRDLTFIPHEDSTGDADLFFILYD